MKTYFKDTMDWYEIVITGTPKKEIKNEVSPEIKLLLDTRIKEVFEKEKIPYEIKNSVIAINEEYLLMHITAHYNKDKVYGIINYRKENHVQIKF